MGERVFKNTWKYLNKILNIVKTFFFFKWQYNDNICWYAEFERIFKNMSKYLVNKG